MAKPARPHKFSFLFKCLKPGAHYSPETIADFVAEADWQPFMAGCCPLKNPIDV